MASRFLESVTTGNDLFKKTQSPRTGDCDADNVKKSSRALVERHPLKTLFALVDQGSLVPVLAVGSAVSPVTLRFPRSESSNSYKAL